MARKISAMPELTESDLAADDYLPIVDTDAIVANQNKRVTIATLDACIGLDFVRETDTTVTVSVPIDQTVFTEPNVVIGTDTSMTAGISNIVLLGTSAEVAQTRGIAIGHNSRSTESGAVAIGPSAAALGVNSIAFGQGAVATANNEMVIGNSDMNKVRFMGPAVIHASGFMVGSDEGGTSRDIYQSNGNYYIGSDVSPFDSTFTVSLVCTEGKFTNIRDAEGNLGSDESFLAYTDGTGLEWNSLAGGNGISITSPFNIAIDSTATIQVQSVQFNGDISLGTAAAAAIQIGNQTLTNGTTAIAIGNSTDSQGTGAVAIGNGASADAYGIAIGYNAATTAANECRIGTDAADASITDVYLGNGAATLHALNVPLRREAVRFDQDNTILHKSQYVDTVNPGIDNSGEHSILFSVSFSDANYLTTVTLQTAEPLYATVLSQTTDQVDIQVYDSSGNFKVLPTTSYVNVVCESLPPLVPPPMDS